MDCLDSNKMHTNGDTSTTHLNGHAHTNGNGHSHTNGDSNATTTTRGLSPRPRKDSSPLAPPFIVSAPGKTIVYGEHAVVHGKAAIAAAISLRSYLLVTTLSKSHHTVSLRFTDIGLDHTWNIPDLPWKAFAHPARKKRYYDLVTSLDRELVEAMQPHIVDVGKGEESPEKVKVRQAAASAFLYLFLSLGSEKSPGCEYAMRSAIPIAAGLGSSASVSVCISAALLIQCRALAGPHPDQQGKEAEEQLERINRWAFVAEMLIHGNPSGVDNTVATNGHAVLFQRKDYARPPSVTVLRDFPELPLLLVDTCVPKSTATEVAKVASLKGLHPTVVENCLDAIDSITRSVYERITSEDFESGSPDEIKHLGELMGINHGLLTSLGVSHPRLERLRYLVDQSGVGWTKLTGAGGGGCAITLLKPDILLSHSSQSNGDAAAELNGEAGTKIHTHSTVPAPTALENLTEQLHTEGFKKYQTTLGGDGVGVLYPAVIGEEEIDMQMFLTAEGREGVEELVGGGRDKEAWKFWRP